MGIDKKELESEVQRIFNKSISKPVTGRIGVIKDIQYTEEEGGNWLPLNVHSVKFPDGLEWDALNGVRGKRGPGRPPKVK